MSGVGKENGIEVRVDLEVFFSLGRMQISVDAADRDAEPLHRLAFLVQLGGGRGLTMMVNTDIIHLCVS